MDVLNTFQLEELTLPCLCNLSQQSFVPLGPSQPRPSSTMYCKHPGCLVDFDSEDEDAQTHHDQVFNNNCGVCGCFSGSSRTHMLRRRHHVCGFGRCKGKNVKFRTDADVRRHWNAHHRGAGEEPITTDRYGNSLNGDDDDDGYYTESAS